MNAFLLIGLLLLAANLLINRFVRRLPDWLAIALSVLAIILLVLGFIRR